VKLTGLRNLSGREKGLVVGAGAVLVLFLVYQLGYVPLFRSRETYQARAEEMESRLQTLSLLADAQMESRERYRTLAGELERKRGVSVLSYLEDEARKTGIRESIEYVKPRGTEQEEAVTKSLVEIKIDAVSLASLIEFLAGAERNRKGLTVTYLRLKPFFKDRSKVDAVVRLTDVMVLE
jgi:general secretion pathway protein M